ncbi:MAG: sulfite exporter TauE/SafE family protein [Bacteriovoracaceae bacterium]
MFSTQLIILCLASFSAGFVDSIVGGGGLIQLPALILALPGVPLVTVLGTNKMVSVTGTAISSWRFSRTIPYVRAVLFPAMLTAFVASFLGAWTVSVLDNQILKPIFTVLLFGIFLLTIRKQNFGMEDHDPNVHVPIWKPLLLGGVIGFYDGFFGPGTGSLLIIAFVGMMSMTFVQGSAYAKMINLTTNVAAILLFVSKGAFLINVALPLMIFNVLGAILGVRLALLKGNTFVRGLLRVMIFATIVKLGYEVWRDYL